MRKGIGKIESDGFSKQFFVHKTVLVVLFKSKITDRAFSIIGKDGMAERGSTFQLTDLVKGRIDKVRFDRRFFQMTGVIGRREGHDDMQWVSFGKTSHKKGRFMGENAIVISAACTVIEIRDSRRRIVDTFTELTETGNLFHILVCVETMDATGFDIGDDEIAAGAGDGRSDDITVL